VRQADPASAVHPGLIDQDRSRVGPARSSVERSIQIRREFFIEIGASQIKTSANS
jgi:hypothetical protein